MGYQAITCSNCGATVDFDPERLTSYCIYCGSKLTVDVETLSRILNERERTKQEELRTEQVRYKSQGLFASLAETQDRIEARRDERARAEGYKDSFDKEMRQTGRLFLYLGIGLAGLLVFCWLLSVIFG